MGRIGKISVIPKEYPIGNTLESALSRYGMSRMPGTGVMLFPYMEADGGYRTALDENSSIIRRIEDTDVREAKAALAKEKRERLEKATGIELHGRSNYYHYGYVPRNAEGRPLPIRVKTVEPFKLIDGDNIFDFSDPWQEITYSWLSVHPKIAPSYEAYQRGDCPPDLQFYVKDDEIENELKFRKKKTANDAIIKFSSFSLEKREKIARLCGLPLGDSNREEVIYNLMDDFLKAKEVPAGPFKGSDPIRIFGMYADLDNHTIYVKDLIEQAFSHTIYRIKKGKIYEGELEVFATKEEMLEHLLDENNQDDVLAMEKKLKTKKLAQV
jgi:hypothetical protein